jgi:mannose-6-phosphate isomerase-like protein (cupin superfamily)
MKLLHVSENEPTPHVRLGPYQIETLIPEEDEAAGTAYRIRIEPHQTTGISYHQVAEEFYLVLEGSGRAMLNGIGHPLKKGDFLRLPPGTRHGFITGSEPLVMLDIHVPGSRPDRDVFFEGETPEGFTKPVFGGQIRR